MSVPRLFSTAHLPAFLWQSSPFTAKLFREAVERLGVGGAAHVPPLSPTTANSANGAKDTTKKTPPPPHTKTADANTMLTVRPAREWLHHERMGMHLHMAHRIVEWDVWEEGLGEEHEHDEVEIEVEGCKAVDQIEGEVGGEAAAAMVEGMGLGIRQSLSRRRDKGACEGRDDDGQACGKLFATDLELERERLLDTMGDICGACEGELGRRLEVWLTVVATEERDGDDGHAKSVENGSGGMGRNCSAVVFNQKLLDCRFAAFSRIFRKGWRAQNFWTTTIQNLPVKTPGT
ncbi:hypothetical protein B0H19DRAFT_1372572 [Mycena capillaripes]|nr:hypothetical protein B0H19DRAFT_1372572 [Mycena capillaripes]